MARPTDKDHANKIQAAIGDGSAARSSLIASWARSSQLYKLDPLQLRLPERVSEQELQHARERLAPLISTTQSSLDRLYKAVGGVGCCVMLADRNGIVLERRGAPADDDTFSRWGLWTGAVWSEQQEGTNGIGTCITEQRPVTIHRDQHFHARNTGLSCLTAPIHDHQGRLAAALDVSSCRADLTEDFTQLIAMALHDTARRIETDLFRLMFAGTRVMLAPVSDPNPGALLAVDAHDMVVGATRAARQALNLTDAAFARALPAADLMGEKTKGDERALAEAEKLAIQRALARASGKASSAAKALNISRATLYRKMSLLGIRRAD